ncbi:MAG TPA: serpin family protein [Gemmatimonadales bacterium]|jgi:serpin B|nr:serpin family protein [Gemmatimonadales bacterium]
MRSPGSLALGASLVLLAACGSPTDRSPGPPPLLTALPRSLTAAESRLIAAGNEFGFSLFREARAAAPDGNAFLSPTSAAMALGMTLNGAATATFDSMRVALRLGDASQADINAGFRSLIDLLRGLDNSSRFEIANSIWARAGVPFFPMFLDIGRASFDAEVRALDFGSPTALPTINDWVKQKTGGKIPTILDQIAGNEVMFLINAIYFKGSWRVAFDPAKTRTAAFHAADGTTQQVPTMVLEPSPLRYGGTEDAEVVELLYGNGAFAMTLVLPRSGKTLGDLVAGLDTAQWNRWTATVHEAEIGLTLPRFQLEYQRRLNDDLSALGMRIAFDDRRADFTRMADVAPERLYLTKVIQKTFVDVNEEGTEAAAATSVGIGVTSLPMTVAVDRPFLFAIRERLSGTILFLGQIARIPGV